MAVTQSQNNGDGIVRLATGSYIESGTAVAIGITCGFRPRYIRVVNQTSKDMMEWFEGMTSAHGIKTVAAGTRTAVTSNGITPETDGFTIGLDTDVNVTAEQLRWVAFG
jgi:hypothetical protein